MENNVLCIGPCVFDLTVKLESSGSESAAVYHEVAIKTGKVQINTGGDATNQSIILTRLGANVKLVGAVGDCTVGSFIKSSIQADGVNVDDVVVLKNQSSPVTYMLLKDNEIERRTVINSPMPDFTIPATVFQGQQVVSLASLFQPPMNTKEKVAWIVKTAKKNGSIVCADMKIGQGMYRIDEVGDLLPYFDYMLPNIAEAKYFTGKDSLDDMADSFLNYGVKHIIIKMGKDGSFLKTKKERHVIPAYHVEVVADTLGAGDNFAAGFISAVLDNKSPYDCCKFASATSAINIQEIGANTGVRSKEQVLKYMKENE